MMAFLGFILLMVLCAYLLGAAFFLIVPTFGEPSKRERLVGLCFLVAVWFIGRYAFANAPFAISWVAP